MSDDDRDDEVASRKYYKRQFVAVLDLLVQWEVDVSDLPLYEIFCAAADLDLRGPRLPHPARASFANLPFEVSKCFKKTRFERDDLPVLKDALGLPDVLESSRSTSVHGLRFSSEEALLVLLVRLAWPHRLDPEMTQLFLRSKGELSEIIWTTLLFISRAWGGLASWWPHAYSAENLRVFAGAVEEVAKLVDSLGERAAFLGFVTMLDGTPWEIAKTGGRDRVQAALYDGKDAMHAVKCQAALLMCGIAHGFCGPYQGTLHDSRMLDDSKFRERFTAALAPHRRPGTEPPAYPAQSYFMCYSDVAYRQDGAFAKPFEKAAPTAEQALFNDRMKTVRIAVEWWFGRCKTLWKFLAMGVYALRLALNPVPAIITCAFILTNAHCCLYGNQISQYFDVAPPPLRVYFQRKWMNASAETLSAPLFAAVP
jgi:hypothetical protein